MIRIAVTGVGLVIAAWVLWPLTFGGLLPPPFRQRICQGKGWRTAFPHASKQEIRDFLLLFVDAFAFRQTDKLKLSPEDNVMSLYRSLYPHRWLADALEVETLAEDLRKKYSVELAAVWNEGVTLGALFAHVQNHRHARLDGHLPAGIQGAPATAAPTPQPLQ